MFEFHPWFTELGSLICTSSTESKWVGVLETWKSKYFYCEQTLNYLKHAKWEASIIVWLRFGHLACILDELNLGGRDKEGRVMKYWRDEKCGL